MSREQTERNRSEGSGSAGTMVTDTAESRRVRLFFRREGTAIDHTLGRVGETYAEALLAHCIVPDTVLIFHAGRWLPEDTPIEEDEVVIIATASRG
jgi:hypothetical protein